MRGWNGYSRETAPRCFRREVREGRSRPASPAIRGCRSRGRDAGGGQRRGREGDWPEESADVAAAAQSAASASSVRAPLATGNLPAHLPRIEQILEPESILCPCGCGAMQRVGESRTERLDVIPAQFRVLVTVRPKYVCRTCAGAQHAQAPAPEWLVPRGLPVDFPDAMRPHALSHVQQQLRLKLQVQHPRPAGHRMLRWTNDTSTSTARNVA
ncbi:transposase IS66-like protein [Rhodobacter capsulatus]|nr:transposase IS66-like protein [Rhodobacter capsulatus]